MTTHRFLPNTPRVFGLTLTAVVAAAGGVLIAALCGLIPAREALLLCLLPWVVGVSLTDLHTGRIPNVLTLPLLLLGLVVNVAAGLWVNGEQALASSSCAFIGLTVFVQLCRRQGWKSALGMGDVKLVAAIAAWGGFAVLYDTLLWGSLAAVAGLLLLGRVRGPVGPYLVSVGWISLLVRGGSWL